jgi:prepilin signal peptidase PulO-like enzyme (type II secretory pathway)
VKLVVLLGAGLGWSVAGALALAFLSVFPVALAIVIRGGLSARKSTLPFGPFLALGGLFVLLVPHLAGLGAS